VVRNNYFETLEGRQLLSATVEKLLAPITVGRNSTEVVVSLAGIIDDPALGKQVRLQTNLGNIDIQLALPSDAPETIHNFLSYVNSGRYNGTIFHSSVNNSISGIQGGGFAPEVDTNGNVVEDESGNIVYQPIATDPAIINEFRQTTTVAAANIRQGDIFKITVAGGVEKTFTALDDSTTPAMVAAGLKAALGTIDGLNITVSGGNLLITTTHAPTTVTVNTSDGDPIPNATNPDTQTLTAAVSVAQKVTIVTAANITAGDVFTVTIGATPHSFKAPADVTTPAQVATGLQSALGTIDGMAITVNGDNLVLTQTTNQSAITASATNGAGSADTQTLIATPVTSTNVTAANIKRGDIFRLTVGSTTVSFTAPSSTTTAADVATGLNAALGTIPGTSTAVSGNNLVVNSNLAITTDTTNDLTNPDNQILTATVQKVNVSGTIAMAKLDDDPNSATDQFFINTADNSASRDQQNGGCYTVFGNIMAGSASNVGMALPNLINGKTTQAGFSVTTGNYPSGSATPTFANLPIVTFGGQTAPVSILDAFELPNVSFSAKSDNIGVAVASIDADDRLVLSMGNFLGTAHIKITGTSNDSTESTVLTIKRVLPLSAQTLDDVVWEPDGGNIDVTVTYSGKTIDDARAAFNKNTLMLTGNNGFQQPGSVLSTPTEKGNKLTVTYSVPNPNGQGSTNGQYLVELRDGAAVGTSFVPVSFNYIGKLIASDNRSLVPTLTKTPTTLDSGGSQSVTYTIKNGNPLNAANGVVTVNLYASQSGFLNNASGVKPILIASTKQNVSLPGKGLSAAMTMNFVTPELPAGDYNLILQVVPGTSIVKDRIAPASTVSVGTASEVIASQLHHSFDLNATFDGTLPTAIIPASKKTIMVRITNHGEFTAKGSGTVTLVATPTNPATNPITLLTLPKSLNLKPGQSVLVPMKLTGNAATAIAGVTHGQYFLEATVNLVGGDGAVEKNASDNSIFSLNKVVFN